jgi:hypothetical protein
MSKEANLYGMIMNSLVLILPGPETWGNLRLTNQLFFCGSVSLSWPQKERNFVTTDTSLFFVSASPVPPCL